MKNISVICYHFLLLVLMACSKEPPKQFSMLSEFDELMGSHLPEWQFIQTRDDFENLQFFKRIYENNLTLLNELDQKRVKIPKVLHFIWLGPKPFPRESIDNVRSWIGKHPDWEIKFWTDRRRPLPHPKMEQIFVQDFPFLKLGRFFHQSDNYGEKSDLLRYEILFQEGGVYVDHDVKCFKPFDPLTSAYDLFCGLELPYKTCLSSSVLPTNNILGSCKGHPVLARSLDWLEKHWDQIEHDYPGRDRDSTINRVAHRTFLVLGEMFKQFANQGEHRDMIFPAFYFNSPKDEWALYSRHLYSGSWFENESAFEKMVRERLMMLSKKTNKLLLVLAVIGSLNIIGFTALFFMIRRKELQLRQLKS